MKNIKNCTFEILERITHYLMHLDDIEGQFYASNEGGKALIKKYRDILRMLLYGTFKAYNDTDSERTKRMLKQIFEKTNKLYNDHISILPRPSEPVELIRFERVIARQITRLSPDNKLIKAVLSMNEKDGEGVSVDHLNEFKKEVIAILKKEGETYEVCGMENSEDEKANITIPRIDASNTFRWPTLIHEVSHILLPQLYSDGNKDDGYREKLFREFSAVCLIDRDNIPDDISVIKGGTANAIKNWLVECWCDVIACVLIGPSFYFSQYLVFVNREKANSITQAYPPAFFRLGLIRGVIHHRFPKLVWLLNPYFKECEELIEHLHEIESHECRKKTNNLLSCFNEFFQDYITLSADKRSVKINIQNRPTFNTTFNDLSAKFFYVDDKIVGKLKERLGEGLPVPSIKIAENGNYKEIPSYVQEIFLASWLSRFDTMRNKVLDVVKNREGKTQDYVSIEVVGLIKRHNDAILKSIQVSEWFDMLNGGEARPQELTLFNNSSIEVEDLIKKDREDKMQWNMPGVAVLNDTQITKLFLKEELEIIPMMDISQQIGTTSLDIRLGTCFQVFSPNQHGIVDHGDDNASDFSSFSRKINVDLADGIIITPGQFLLGHSMEYVKLPNYLCGSIEGRSSFARLGIEIHMTAGFIDPGFEGVITLEIYNAGPMAVKLYPGIRIGQLLFEPNRVPHKKYSAKNVKYRGAMEHGMSMQKVDPEMEKIKATKKHMDESRTNKE